MSSTNGLFAVHVDHSIFVGDLAPEVTDYMLQEHFRQYYPSVRSAKVLSCVKICCYSPWACCQAGRLCKRHL